MLRYLQGLVLLAVLLVVLQITGSTLLEPARMLWLAASAILIATGIVDLLRAIRSKLLEVQRTLPRSLALGRENRVDVLMKNPTGRRAIGCITDHVPDSVKTFGIPRSFSIPPEGELAFHYDVEPTERGELDFHALEIEIQSPWGLWLRKSLISKTERLRVYPDFLTIDSLREFSGEGGATMLGVHLQRKRGEGTEFRQLREFREGDILRQVDWKASARMCKLISREYQDENDRDLIFLLDCGRRMRGRDGSLSHFDRALNAILLTSYFALRQGDSVGVCTFAGDERWIEPIKHNAGINHLLNQLYDLNASTQSSDFLDATRRLASLHSKRALVVLVSTLHAEDQRDISKAIRVLGKQHAVIVANMRESELVQYSRPEVDSFDTAIRHAVATELLGQRERLVRRLHREGAWVVDCVPQEFNVRLVEQYLALKRAGVS